MDGFVLVNESNFDQVVLNSPVPVLLEFGGVWCKPCKSLEPLLLKLKESWGERIQLAKVDVDECPNVAMRFQVMSLPTTMLFTGGRQQEIIVGLQSADKFREKIDPYL